MSSTLHLLVGEDPGDVEGIPTPLFLREDHVLVVKAMPTFDSRGLVSAVPPECQGAMAPVEVYFDGSREGGEGDEEDEELDREETTEGTGETSPGTWPASSVPCRTTTRPTPHGRRTRL